MTIFLKNPVLGRVQKILFLLIVCCLFSSNLIAQDFVFTGNQNGNWGNANNWEPSKPSLNPFTGNSITVERTTTINDILTLNSGSSLIINDGITASYNPSGMGNTLTNNGSIIINGTGNLTINSNQILANAGSINFTGGGSITNNGTMNQSTDGASLSGSGTITSSELAINGGSISPGNSFGTMTITGSMTLSTGVILSMEIIGGGVSADNDVIDVSGTLNLGGSTLIVTRTNGSFTTSESWDIITAGTLSGSFAASPTLPVVSLTPPGLSGTFSSSDVGNIYRVVYSGDAFLPIELASFSGEAVDNTIELNWTTVSELNNDYLIVERSADGLEFRDVGRVDGKGTTNVTQSYTFVDQSPLDGFNYYRLRQVDLDGTEHQSNVIVIDMDMKIDGIKLQAYPNPSQDNIRLSWQSSQTSNSGHIHLIEAASGKILQRFAMPEGTNMMDIPVNDLPSGLYVIQVIQANQRKSLQFVKN